MHIHACTRADKHIHARIYRLNYLIILKGSEEKGISRKECPRVKGCE